ncbi:hypothetical protein [Nocardiopsis ansamitocini]|uniref:Uncharacterized protein n=1 Tax=Nocardiopsis ansamitocini TaxID=1670832 RepID=A0A9W6ULC7_9ACTN|nr:hypothetical protein [Nocardiopsis ansamitocini]GLU50523.1 hypothetical protein Nans01_48740 [Nocardiopsis ansamitocini]
MSDEEIIAEILDEGLDDWIPIDGLISLVKREGKESEEDLRNATIRILRLLLEGRMVTVGELGESGFESWPESVDDAEGALLRVVEDLDRLDWFPQGASCWIANTPLGDAEAVRNRESREI